jgi:hypothetical protein
MRRLGRWPWGLVGMVALIWAMESSVARHRFDFLDLTTVTWAMSSQAVGRESVKSEVLCFGDSLLKFGLYPAVIERRLNKSSYNLAANGSPSPATFFLLRRALAAGATPSAVLVDFDPNSLSNPSARPPEWWAELVSPRDCVELAWATKDVDFLARTLLARYLPSERYRLQIRAAVLGALRGQPAAHHDNITSLLNVWNVHPNRGALVWPHGDRVTAEIHPPHPVFFPPDWHCDALNGHYVRKFFALASAHGIPVFWVLPPYSSPIQSYREQLGPDATFTRFAYAVRSRFPGVTVLDGRRSGYAPSVFWDGAIHLDGQGALVLSADVADVLNRSFCGETIPAWVHLPAYRARPLEDAPSSGLALGDRRTRAR